MTEIHLDQIWNEFDKYLDEIKNKDEESKDLENICRLCGSKYDNWDFADICKNCGYVDREYKFFTGASMDINSNTQEFNSKKPKGNNKVLKLNEWYMWTDQEKQDYKLKMYIEERCKILELNDMYVSQVVDCMIRLFKISKTLLLGTKRSKIKDSIILVLGLKLANISQKYIDLYKNDRKIDVKHMTKAEKIILEIMQKDRVLYDILNINKNNKTPFDLIEEKLDKIHELYPFKKLIEKVINIIIDNDILLDNTPMSIGVTSVYYVIQKLQITIHLKTLCELFNISVVTVSKTYQKLVNIDDKLWKKIQT